MSKEAWEAVQANSHATGGELAYLQLAAYRTFDKVSPFTVRLSPEELAAGLHVSDSMVRRYQRNLVKLGELTETRADDDRRKRVYKINLRIPELSFRNQPQDTGTIVPDVAEVSELSFRNLPQSIGTIVPQQAKVSELVAQSIGTNTPIYRNDRSVVPYKEKYIETDREVHVETDTPPRVREEGEMGDPLTVSTMWSEIIQYLRDHLEQPINGYEVTRDEVDEWVRKVRPTMPGPHIICLRGPRAIVHAMPFQGVTSAAAGRLYDHRVIVDYWSA